MKNKSSENKLVITEEFIFDQNKLSKDPNNHFKVSDCDPWHEYITIWARTIKGCTHYIMHMVHCCHLNIILVAIVTRILTILG